MVETIPMIQDFPRWLATIGIADNEATLTARWAGVNSLVGSASREATEALLRIALKTRQPPAAPALQKVRDAFHAADNTFQMQGNDKELRVLAGAALAACLAGQASVASETSLAVSTAMFAGRKTDLPLDLNVLAEASIVRTAESKSTRPDLSTLASAEKIQLNFENAATKAKEGNFDHVASAFGLAAQSTSAALNTAESRLSGVINALNRYLRTQDEELQMLWWLVGERSLDLDCRLDEVGVDLQPFVFAKELAGLTQYLPGPRGVRALLSRAGLKERRKISLADVVNAADPTWLRSFMPDREFSPVTTPFHFAVSRQLETGAGQAWIQGWAASVELPATTSLPALGLGMQIYRERLLILSAPRK
jgi:hypothetical protein